MRLSWAMSHFLERGQISLAQPRGVHLIPLLLSGKVGDTGEQWDESNGGTWY